MIIQDGTLEERVKAFISKNSFFRKFFFQTHSSMENIDIQPNAFGKCSVGFFGDSVTASSVDAFNCMYNTTSILERPYPKYAQYNTSTLPQEFQKFINLYDVLVINIGLHYASVAKLTPILDAILPIWNKNQFDTNKILIWRETNTQHF